MTERMTRVGLERLKNQLSQAEQELGEVQLYKGTDAIHQGDHWHDNPALQEAELRERVLIRRVNQLRKRIRNAEIVTVEDVARPSNVVAFGSTVEIDLGDGEVVTFQLLGSADARASEGIISVESPLGKALLGAHGGETREYTVDGKNIFVVHVLRVL